MHKFRFYARNILEHLFVPDTHYEKQRNAILSKLDLVDKTAILDRVNYYNKLSHTIELPHEAQKLADLTSQDKTSYYYDYRRILRFFPKHKKLASKFGDVKSVSLFPRIVKTRPIDQPNENSVLLKLNSVRHYRKITDTLNYREKKGLLVWRGKVKQDHRQIIFNEFFHHPLCDIGKTNHYNGDPNQQWNKPRLSIQEQLQYKFILSIEGNEVATNLKWIAQSNSLCFMTRPKFESWFMEGRLEASKHYVELRDDYADLPQKIKYYTEHPEEAELIISNFKNYYRTFLNEETELLVSLLVVDKYLTMTSQ